MNFKLILQLSGFGLAMGIATVFLIPSNVEPLFWLVVLLATAYLIATRTSAGRFLHGLMVGIVNSVWVTGSHIVWFDHYIAHHPKEAAMMTTMPLPQSPRLMMILVGLVIGVVSGTIIGLVALLAAKFVPKPATH